jgi:hypothetical protein
MHARRHSPAVCASERKADVCAAKARRVPHAAILARRTLASCARRTHAKGHTRMIRRGHKDRRGRTRPRYNGGGGV